MGLPTASVRRPDTDVMAPALTHTTQTQSFDLTSETRLKSSSPMNNFETNKYSPTIAKSCNDIGKTSKNNSNDVDQLFNNSLDTNVEDLMRQVLKTIESNEQSNSSLVKPLDLNNSSDLNEVLDLNIDKELLEHVDSMINLSVDDPPDEMEVAQKIKQNQANILLADLQKKHIKMERHLDFLKRRCSKVTSKLIGQHLSNEIAGVFEHINRTIKRPTKECKDTQQGENRTEETRELTPLLPNCAKTLVRKLEMATILQARQKVTQPYFGSGNVDYSLCRTSANSGQIHLPTWKPEHKQELQKIAAQLHSDLRVVQNDLDSEATESSSGGDSCDEMTSYNNPHQQYLSIQKRALWKYSVERAAIASRWTWLQSQISDLEYRIRQYTELYKQVRASKGPIQLGGVSGGGGVGGSNGNSATEVKARTDNDNFKTSDNTSNTTVNGYLGQLPGAVGNKIDEGDTTDCEQCSRTRPLINFKKRRLLQIADLHVISKKAARPSTIRCSCTPAQGPCALCTGRVDPMFPRDSLDTLGKAEKIALLDPGFHPILSFLEDSSQTLHIESIMKLPEWQEKSVKIKSMKILNKNNRLDQKTLDHRTNKLDHRKKYSRLKNSTVTALSEKIKNKLKRRKVGRPAGVSKLKRRQNQLTMYQNSQNLEPGCEDANSETIANNSSINTPQAVSGYKHPRNNRVDSYDIDNIVIPYSVAASTRVEKLQYKEILTPKWRLINLEPLVRNNGDALCSNDDSDVEDLSEEVVIARHDRCERDEKKRFLSYLKLPAGYKNRLNKRHDTTAENSRANTPDPASPYSEGAKIPDGSVAGSPPSTPGTLTDDSVALMRKRTISQSRYVKDNRDDSVFANPEYPEQPPYEPRNFPLTDIEYDRMIQDMPDHYREVKTNFRAQDIAVDFCPKRRDPDEIDSESTESAIGDDAMLLDELEEALLEDDEEEDEEDPNDPEWTDAEKAGSKDRHHRR